MYFIRSRDEHGDKSEDYLGAHKGQIRHFTAYTEKNRESVDVRQADESEVDTYHQLIAQPNAKLMSPDLARALIKYCHKTETVLETFAFFALVEATANPKPPSE